MSEYATAMQNSLQLIQKAPHSLLDSSQFGIMRLLLNQAANHLWDFSQEDMAASFAVLQFAVDHCREAFVAEYNERHLSRYDPLNNVKLPAIQDFWVRNLAVFKTNQSGYQLIYLHLKELLEKEGIRVEDKTVSSTDAVPTVPQFPFDNSATVVIEKIPSNPAGQAAELVLDSGPVTPLTGQPGSRVKPGVLAIGVIAFLCTSLGWLFNDLSFARLNQTATAAARPTKTIPLKTELPPPALPVVRTPSIQDLELDPNTVYSVQISENFPALIKVPFKIKRVVNNNPENLWLKKGYSKEVSVGVFPGTEKNLSFYGSAGSLWIELQSGQTIVLHVWVGQKQDPSKTDILRFARPKSAPDFLPLSGMRG